MADTNRSPLTGHCDCGKLSYRLAAPPLFVHACHCLDCKRHSNSAFILTTIVLETDVVVARGAARPQALSSTRTDHVCDDCGQRIWTTAPNHPATALLNTGTLDDSRQLDVGAHIWVKRKQPWLMLPDEVPQFEEAYDRETTWPAESLERLRRSLAGRPETS